MKYKSILVLLLLCYYSNSYAQSIVRSSLNSFGNTVQKNGIQLSQTAGQSSNYSVFNSDDQSSELRQGFQQADRRDVQADSKFLNFTLYPNPNYGSFSIRFNERIEGTLNYRLIDNQGRIYRDEKIASNMANHFNFTLPSGSYILQLENSTGKIGTTKLIIL